MGHAEIGEDHVETVPLQQALPEGRDAALAIIRSGHLMPDHFQDVAQGGEQQRVVIIAHRRW
jgi:hypothetical protein